MKKIYAIDFAVIIGSVLVLIILIGYTAPKIIAPIDGYETNKEVLFSIENADKLLIDDNQEFTSPEEYDIKDNLEINLKPGDYYWKAVGLTRSEVRKLTINSEIDLRLKKSQYGYDIVNAGNVELTVDIYNNTKLIGNIILEIDDSESVNGDKFVGSDNE